MPDLPPIRVYFHEVKNRLNVMNAMAFTVAAGLKEAPPAMRDEVMMQAKETLDALKDEYMLLSTSFTELIQIVHRDVGITQPLIPAFEKLNGSYKELMEKKEKVFIAYAEIKDAAVPEKLILFLDEFYEQIHAFAGCLEDLKSAIKAIGKYPA